MDRYTASCAVCGGPADPDCSCESHRLNMSIDQAERRWLDKWREDTREWVANHAITFVTNTFNTMKAARIQNHQAYIRALPYWPLYEQHRGRPNLHPHIVAELQFKIQQGEMNLRRNIDADWKDCVIRYPEVLAHYYSLVNVSMPKDVDPPFGTMPTMPGVGQPGFGMIDAAAAAQQHQRQAVLAGATADLKKQRRKSAAAKSSSAGESDLEHMHRDFQRRLAGMGVATSGLDGLHAISAQLGLKGHGGGQRTTSRVGRGTPAPSDAHHPKTGKKRHNAHFVLSGRESAPPQVPVPPGWDGLAGRF